MTREIEFRGRNGKEMVGRYELNQRNLLDLLNSSYRELMQRTGLKDKNGVKVFEGDIVKCTKGCPHEVIWVKEYGGMYVGGMPAFYLSGLKEGYAWTGEEEVIGNIYENPSLLSKDTDD